MTINLYDFGYSQSSKVELLPKLFNPTHYYNESWIDDNLSIQQLPDSSQSHFYQSIEIDDSTTNLLSNTSENFKVELRPRPFDLSAFYNESRIDEFLSRYKHFGSSQSHSNQSIEMDDSTTNLLSNKSQNCEEWHTNNASQHDGLTLEAGLYNAALVTACIGLTLNATGIYLLSRRKGYKNMFNILLTINLIFDSLYLAFQIPRSLYTYFISTNPSATYYMAINLGQRFSQTASVLMLVAFAHSRYQAVSKPYKVRELQLSWSSRRKQLLMYLLPTISFAASFAIPVVYEIDTEKITLCNHTLEIVVPSEMRLNPYYSIFFLGSLNLVFLGLFPFLSLLYFSYYIKKSLDQRLIFMAPQPHNESLKRRNAMNNKIIEWKNPANLRNERHCNTNKAAKTFLMMVFTFILLHSLRFVTSLGDFIVLLGKHNISDDDLKYQGGPKWLNVVGMFGSFCMVLNASINFLIYLYLNPMKRINVVHRCIPLINNTLMSTINVNQSSPPSQHKLIKEAPLQDEGKNEIISVALIEAPVADHLNSTIKVSNENENFVVIKIGTEWL